MLTKKELLELWKKYDFKPNRRLGQNFLIDKNVKDKLIRYINPNKQDIILEIGAGFAELTADLSKGAKKVVALEKDKRITHILRSEALKNRDNVKIEESDFLEYVFKDSFGKVVGNLPYYITTPIIERLVGPEFKRVEGIFIMVQREYADRILAKRGTKDYSSLSCFLQYKMDTIKLMSINKQCFFPSPEVDSVFLKLNSLERPRVKVRDEKFFFKIIRGAFQQRRKTLANSLSGNVSGMDKNRMTKILKSIAINKNARAEELSLEEFSKIAEAIWLQKK